MNGRFDQTGGKITGNTGGKDSPDVFRQGGPSDNKNVVTKERETQIRQNPEKAAQAGKNVDTDGFLKLINGEK